MGLIIGLAGRKNSGKSTSARMICEMVPNAVEIAFADPMKEFAAKIFDWPMELLNGPSEGKEKPDERYRRHGGFGEGPEFLSPRMALQCLGTEWGRHCYENVWVDYALRRAHQLLAEESFPGPGGAPSSLVVISDVRFVNEAEAIYAAGGKVIKIVRGLEFPSDSHASEGSIGEIRADYFVANAKSLGHLREDIGRALHFIDVEISQ